MIIYIEHDTESYGGFFSAMSIKTDPTTLRHSVDEVSAVENFPEYVW
jgi:hypothetical protein